MQEQSIESGADGAGAGKSSEATLRARARRLRWTDVVDLEARLEADAAWPAEDLHARDRAIGASIGARDLDDRTAIIAWIDAQHDGSAADAGARARHLRDQLAALLMLAGFATGALSVGGWLSAGGDAPVNVIDLWPLLVGGQLGLVLLWLIAALPSLGRWPVIGPLHTLLREVLAWIPRAAARCVARFAHGPAETWSHVLAEMRRLEWLYGRLRFWLLARLSQVFAISFNLGAIVAFIVMPTIDDPAFGWRSRLLDEAQVIAWSDALSAPLAWVWADARPGAEVVRATRYSSVAERYARDPAPDAAGVAGPDAPWAAWWPFLLASLVAYGLVPRLLYWTLGGFAIRRALAGLSFDRPEIARVVARLRQSVVDTRALAAETGTRIDADGYVLPDAGTLALARMASVWWESVALDGDELAALLEARFGVRPEAVGRVGGLDRADDAAVLARLADLGAGTGVFLTMASWEPPVGDHVDFVSASRAALPRDVPIVIALYNRAPGGAAVAPEAAQTLVWRRRIARLGDPFMSVEALVASTEEPA